MPDDDRQWVIDAAKTVPGVLNAYHLVDEATGDGLSIAFFDRLMRNGSIDSPTPISMALRRVRSSIFLAPRKVMLLIVCCSLTWKITMTPLGTNCYVTTG